MSWILEARLPRAKQGGGSAHTQLHPNAVSPASAHLGLLAFKSCSRIAPEVATTSLLTNLLNVRRSIVSSFEKPATPRRY